jgi:hypothetical protein
VPSALLALVAALSRARDRWSPRVSKRSSLTAAQEQKLKALPADKVTSVQKSGKTYYVFPDAANNQAYVGGPKQCQAYRQLRLEKKLADEKLEAAEMNLDASMDWGGWGGWGAVGGWDGIEPTKPQGSGARAARFLGTFTQALYDEAQKQGWIVISMKKAGDELEQLGQSVKSGAVKSGDELKKSFAHVDNALAKAWHATAEESMKAGKDAGNALKKAGDDRRIESRAAFEGGRGSKIGGRVRINNPFTRNRMENKWRPLVT